MAARTRAASFRRVHHTRSPPMKSLLPLTISLFAGPAALAVRRDTAAPFAPIPARIAFVSDRRLGQRDIWLMNTDGSVQLVTNHLADDDWPSWSPDGTHIAFESDRSLNYDIYSTTLDGSVVVRLTADTAFDGQPAWSPDGAKIAFVSDRDGAGEIYVMNVDGTGPANLTNNAANDLAPAWSPDGSKIAFQSTRDGSDFAIYVMNANGSGVM